MKKLILQINNCANNYNRTKQIKYKKEWYKLINKFSKLYGKTYNSLY